MMVDLADLSRFFVKTAVSLNIGGIIGLAIGEAISLKTDIAASFSRLFL